MTIHCPQCGPVPVTESFQRLSTRYVINALRVGAAPLSAITCPHCRREVTSKDVEDKP